MGGAIRVHAPQGTIVLDWDDRYHWIQTEAMGSEAIDGSQMPNIMPHVM
jgi:hypothetical protein